MTLTKEEIQQRGEMALRLLNDPMFKEAMEAVERQAMEELLRAPGFSILGDRKRRQLADRINTIRGIRNHLSAQITMGNQAVRGGPQVP